MVAGDKVDCVIVGAGVTGAILAARLAAEGRKVVILEHGPNWRLNDLVSSQIWSRRIKWGGAPVESGGQHPTGYNFEMGWGSGGSAIHHYAQWPRMHVEDFRSRSLFGRGVDWPISYDDLRPYYDQVQEKVGVSGDHTREPWRPPGAPYPLPPMTSYKQAEVLAAGFQKIGLRTGPMPLAVLSQAYKGRPACIHDGWCDAGCPTGALANPLVTDLPAALKGGAVLRSRVTAGRVLTTTDGKRASGIEYFDASGTRHEQHADVVILANNCIQGSRMLLNSANARQPQGVANSSGTVGQFVLAHFSTGLHGLFDLDMQNHLGTTGAALISQEAYAKPAGSYTWFLAVAKKMSDLIGMANSDASLFGEPLHDFMRRAVKGLASITAIGEQMPRADNRVTLTDKRDAFGLRLARWEHSLDERELKLFVTMREEGLRAMKAAGATQVLASEKPGNQHIAGGLRMGAKAGDSVCDSYGRCHDVPNLVLAGGGIFPTEGAVNPTFTVHALTERTADHLAGNWRSYAA
jgi:choline dehydrogenase-like flavoprotein